MPKSAAATAMHVVFSGGVTGGHLFPGLAVAEQIVALQPAARITFVGPGGPFDRVHVRRAGYEYVAIECPRAPRRMIDVAPFGVRLLRGVCEAARLLGGSASAVVGLGGFASLPAALAASRAKLPLILVEQNAIIGRANRWLSRRAVAVCLGFAGTKIAPRGAEIVPDERTFVTGTPVRASFNSSGGYGDSRRSTLVVLGGSGGARSLNRALPAALRPLRHAMTNWDIVHQAGQVEVVETAAAYRAAGIAASVIPFCDDLAPLLARAGLIVCRAGGSTLAELAVACVPAILVPWAAAVDDHQFANAYKFAERGAAVAVDCDAAAPAVLAERLSTEIAAILVDPARRRAMAAACEQGSFPCAARHVAEVVLNIAAVGGQAEDGESPTYPASPLSIDTRAA